VVNNEELNVATSAVEQVTVLLLEDNLRDAVLATRELQRETWARVVVHHVATLSQALEFLQERDVDIVVTDLGLTDSQGLDTVASLVAAHDLPLVVYTGVDDRDLGLRALEVGADDVVVKTDEATSALGEVLRTTLAREHWNKCAREIVKSSIDAMVLVDHGGTVQFVNPAAERLLGQPSTRLIGGAFPYELDPVTPTQTRLGTGDDAAHVEINARPMHWEGRSATLAILRDVSDRARVSSYQRQLAHADRLAVIGQLAAGVAHEVNNPVAFVSANLQVLERNLQTLRRRQGDPADDAVWEDSLAMLTECHEGIKRITRTVREMTSLARTSEETDRVVPVRELVEIARTMTIHELRNRATLTVELHDAPEVKGDPGRLSQVLINLLINASHAMGRGPDNRISIRARIEGDEVVVDVKDNGPGIPAEKIDKVFEPFFTTKLRTQGTGLGLSICRDIVSQHGGSLTVNSTPGLGACFSMRLPAARPSDREAAVRGRAAAELCATPEHRILLIDDEDALRRSLQRLLCDDYQVVDCAGPAEALALLEQGHEFDAILCDLVMPGMDGVEFQQQACRRWPALRDKLVFMSGGTFTDQARAFANSGEFDILSKPLDAKRLFGALADVVAA